MRPEAYVEMEVAQDTHWWFRGRREILRSLIKDLALPRSSAILEIGAGTGGNLPMLMEFGVVMALESDPYARSVADQRVQSRLDIRYGRLPDELPSAQRFDLICLFDVLEHVERDVDSLAAIRNITSPDGHLLLTVPAYRWLWSSHDEDLHHYRRYNSGELQNKARAAGWNVERLSYFNTILFPLAMLARFADKHFGNRSFTGTRVPAAALNSALYRIFILEKFVLKALDMPFGVSVLARLSPA